MTNANTSSALILVVDDDEAARLMMVTALEKAGFHVLAGEDCAKARELFAEFSFDVALLDVLLPDGDGFNLCREFLSQPKGRDLPIAMVTGLDDLESIQLGYQAGATDFITKPVSWGTLPYRIHYILQSSRTLMNLSISENKLRLSAKVFEGTSEAILITDANLNIISVNRAYQHTMGYLEAEQGATDSSIPDIAGTQLPSFSFFDHIAAVLKERGYWQGELMLQRRNGEYFPCWFSINLVRNDNGEPENYIAIFNDITEHKNSRAKIDFMAHHDSLTGLPNRTLLNDRIEMAINVASREQRKVGVLFIDLDRFKNINDSLGHLAGDQVLKETAHRLTTVIRSGDTVSRLGGDEFVVLFPTISDERNLAELTLKLSAALQQSYSVNGIVVHITPSIGIALYPDDGKTFDTLIKNADAAMYLAKEKGRNNYQFYTPTLNARTLDRLKLESDLRNALELGHFELHYQPLIVGSDGSLRGAEALIRWRHPERGVIAPNDFIPLAEETGLIIPIGEWVLTEAARQVKRWHQQGYTELIVSVNISALQFKHPDFQERITAILKTAEVDPASIELELTESILMGDMDASIQTLQRFCDHGYHIAIDDFGTGFSSLSYLRHLPIHLLKIDQSFVRDMLNEPASLAIVDAIIGLAHAIGKETIAEGVETEAEYTMLMQHGCRLLQGYYFSPPLPAAQFERWVKSTGRYVMRSDVL